MVANMISLERTFQKVLAEQLAPAIVRSIHIEEGEDFEGSEILRVTVVLDVEDEKDLPPKLLGLLRHLREPLEKAKEKRFPVFSFMKPGEFDGAAA